MEGAEVAGSSFWGTMDPLAILLRTTLFGVVRVPRMRLRMGIPALPSAMAVLALILAAYMVVVSGFIYDVIVEPPGIGSAQDPVTGAYKPVVFLSGRVNGQYIIEGLSSGAMFLLGGLGLILLDQALAPLSLQRHSQNKPQHAPNLSLAAAGVSALVISYVMSMLFVRIKIPGYLR